MINLFSTLSTSLFKSIRFLFFGLLYTIALQAQDENLNNRATPEWIVSTDFIDLSRGTSLTVDSFGNSYSTGFFSNKMYLEDSLLIDSCGKTALNANNHFLIKRDKNGTLIWIRYGISSSRVGKIVLDKDGNIYTIGCVFRHSLQLSSVNDSIISRHKILPKSSRPHLFICQYNPNGKILRTKIIITDNPQIPTDCLLDSLGNFIIGGYYQYRSDDSPRTIRSSYSLMKLNNNWEILWQKEGNPSGSSSMNGIALDASSNIYAIGSFTKKIHFDSNYTLQGNQDENQGFVAKYDANGNFKWSSNTLVPSTHSYGTAIACDKGQNIYLLFNTQHTKSFLIKLNAKHQKEWLKEIHGRQRINGILIDDANHLYLFGDGYNGFFDNTALTNSPNFSYDRYSFFIAKYNTYGNLLGLNIEGQNGLHYCDGIALFNNQLLVLGTYSSGPRQLKFGTLTKRTAWYSSIWLTLFNTTDFTVKSQDK